MLKPAKGGENFAALNNKPYVMAGGETMICDDSGMVSMGGLMGGSTTGCDDKTTEMFLEVALFDPIRVAMTGRHHQVLSDARYRFERGLDPAAVIDGMEAATKLILELCGGEASEPVVTGAVPEWKRSYTLRPERCATLGGLDVAKGEQGAHPHGTRLHGDRQGCDFGSGAALVGARMSTARPISSKRSCASSATIRFRLRACRATRRCRRSHSPPPSAACATPSACLQASASSRR